MSNERKEKEEKKNAEGLFPFCASAYEEKRHITSNERTQRQTVDERKRRERRKKMHITSN